MKWPKRLTLVRHGESHFNAVKTAKRKDPEYQVFIRQFEQEMNDHFFDHFVAHWPERCVSDTLLDLAKKMLLKYRPIYNNRETPLAEQGWPQSETLGKKLKEDISLPDVIITSPYLRTLETLEGMKRGWPELADVERVERDELLREIDTGLADVYGDWRIMEVFHPEQRLAYLRVKRHDYYFPQGESIPRVYERMRQFSGKLVREFSGNEVLVVTHHIAIIAFVAVQLRWEADQFLQSDEENPIQNCSYTIFRGEPNLGEDGKLVLDAFNVVTQESKSGGG